MSPTKPIRVLVVDDHPDFLRLLTDYLSRLPEIKVVGVALSGDEALALVRELHPELVLTDLAMPGMNGLETTQQIKKLEPPPRVVVVTLHDDHKHRAQAAAVGADGFLSKSDISVGLLPLIRSLIR